MYNGWYRYKYNKTEERLRRRLFKYGTYHIYVTEMDTTTQHMHL